VEQQLNVFTKEQLTWTAATLSRYKVGFPALPRTSPASHRGLHTHTPAGLY
jgi:hypothetical protein